MTCWAVVGDGSARRSFSSLSLLVVPCLWCACGADRGRPICLLWVREFFLPITHHDRAAPRGRPSVLQMDGAEKGRTVARTE
jgi:hypothetical protein